MRFRTRTAVRAARKGSPWPRIAGYGGALLMVAAAVAVLLYPLMSGERPSEGASGERPAAEDPTGAPAMPGQTAPAAPGAPDPRAGPDQSADPGRGGGQGGGPALPTQGGGTTTWCPPETAVYRPSAAGDALEVVVRASASGLVRAEVSMTGRSPQSQQATATGDRPHTFRFAGVRPETVERVKVTTVSVGVSMQTCYARVAG